MIGCGLDLVSLAALSAGGGAPAPIIMGAFAGQSMLPMQVTSNDNWARRNLAIDVDVPNAGQWGGDSGHTDSFQKLYPHTAPFYGKNAFAREHTETTHPGDSAMSPQEAIARVVRAERGFGSQFWGVPCCEGSTGITLPGQMWHAATGNEGVLFTFLMSQAAGAHAALTAANPGVPILPVLYFALGEYDANRIDGGFNTKADYKTSVQQLFTRWRAVYPGSPIVIGSMVPDKWAPGGLNKTAGGIAVNAAQAELSVEMEGVYYVRGNNYDDLSLVPGLDLTKTDELHFVPQRATGPQPAREYGERIGTIFVDAMTGEGAGPTMTSPNTVLANNGQAFQLDLTASDTFNHYTVHLVDGPNSDLYEISDPYTAPKLRWLNNGTGPATNGDYPVQVVARSGAGIYGTPQTVTTTVQTAVNPLPQWGNIGLFLRADDLTSMWQDTAKASQVSADSQTVGYWADKAAGGFDISAAGNDTTRPLYKTASGVHWVEFDGANDLLRRLDALNLWNASGYTAVFAMRALSNATLAYLCGQGHATTTNAILGVLGSAGVAANTGHNYRNDSSTTVLNSGSSTGVNFLDGTDRVVMIVDNGSSVIAYLDGVAGTSRSYTRAGNTISANRFALGGLLRATAIGFFPHRLHGAAIWPGLNLNSTERAQTNTFFASLQGRAL